MQEQNKRAVESMCRCGLDLENIIDVFPRFPREEVTAIYNSVKNIDADADGKSSISINCS